MKIGIAVLLLLSLFLHASSVCAHQPRIVTSSKVVTIKKPEVSQAFYGTLQGEPNTYKLMADSEFHLYTGILIPDLPECRKDFVVSVFAVDADGQNRLLSKLDGKQQPWETFYEPFVADRYLQGPEDDRTLPAGQYQIIVSNPDNHGKYVLSVGRKEKFTFKETIQTIRRLPAVKTFFNKSPWTAHFNLVGLFMLVAGLLLAALVFGAYWIVVLLRK